MKRKIWVTAGIAAALAFLIAFGAVGCVVSGFDLPLDSYAKVVLICGAASVFCAAAFSLKWGGAAVLCALDGAARECGPYLRAVLTLGPPLAVSLVGFEGIVDGLYAPAGLACLVLVFAPLLWARRKLPLDNPRPIQYDKEKRTNDCTSERRPLR